MKRFAKKEIEQMGTLTVSEEPLRLECKRCHVQWSPTIENNPRGYWICPNQCNTGLVMNLIDKFEAK